MVDDRDGTGAGMGAGSEGRAGSGPALVAYRSRRGGRAGTVGTEESFGRKQLDDAFAAVGAPGLSAEVRVDVEDWHRETELVVQLVNTSPEKAGLTDSHLYETQIEISGLPTVPFQLEALPDSFPLRPRRAGVRSERRRRGAAVRGVPHYGHRSVQTIRPEYWNSHAREARPVVRDVGRRSAATARRAGGRAGRIRRRALVVAGLDARQAAERWTAAMRDEADRAATEVFGELGRLQAGLELLRTRQRSCVRSSS